MYDSALRKRIKKFQHENDQQIKYYILELETNMNIFQIWEIQYQETSLK